MIKRKMSLVITVVMMMNLIVPTFASGTEKIDDYSEHWAADTIQEWFDNEMILGYEDGSFKPDNSISRAEFMTMVNNAYEFTETTEINFDDVNSDEWYYSEVQKAVQAGYIIGDNDDIARPTDDISRQEVAVIITRLNGLAENSDNVDQFDDADNISDWAIGFVGAVAEAEYMIGNDKSEFCPTDDITRAESLVTLDRSMEEKDNNDDSDEETESYAVINEISIEGAELELDFDAEITTYSAIATKETVTITAKATTDSAISFASNVLDSDIEVTDSLADDGGVVYIAEVELATEGDTVVTLKVTAPGKEEREYVITISKEDAE